MCPEKSQLYKNAVLPAGFHLYEINDFHARHKNSDPQEVKREPVRGFPRWWRRGELNPCPKHHPCNFLRAYPTYYVSPVRPPIVGLRDKVVRIHHADTDTSARRSPLINAQARAAVLSRWTVADLSSYQFAISRNCNVISCVYI